MARIHILRVATILADASWFDRLDLTSPFAMKRERAALMLATAIAIRLGEPTPAETDPRQMALPIL